MGAVKRVYGFRVVQDMIL